MNKFARLLIGFLTIQAFCIGISSSDPRPEVAQSPLQTMVSAIPNIMLFIDNTPSMSTILTHPEFSHSTRYPKWNFKANSLVSSAEPALIDGSHIDVGELDQGNCSSEFIEGIRNNAVRCLKLPAAISGSRLYSRRYLDFLFEYFPDGTDLGATDGTGQFLIPRGTRMELIKSAAIQLTDELEHTRLCLGSFSGQENGIKILVPCTRDKQIILDNIDLIEAQTLGSSPLAEAAYQLTRYFRGLPMANATGQDGLNLLPTPLNYRCQGNALVMFTDGIAVADQGQFSQSLESRFSHHLSGNEILPDWDGMHPVTTEQQYETLTIPDYSDGFGDSISSGVEGSSLFLDDLAKFGVDIDLLGADKLDQAGKSFADAFLPGQGAVDIDTTDFKQQNMRSYFISHHLKAPILKNAASHGTGVYRDTMGVSEIAQSLQSSLRSHKNATASGAPVALSRSETEGGVTIYQSRYQSGDWSGSLLAHRLVYENTSVNDSELSALWDAGDQIPDHGRRNILTSQPYQNQGVDQNRLRPILFQWEQLDTHQQSWLENNPDILHWLRGSDDNTISNNGGLRNRNRVLGDIVHSGPVILPKIPAYDYPDQDYQYFVQQQASIAGPPIVFAGANDGMLHGFAGGAQGGEEVFSYIPYMLFPKLAQLANPAYSHQYYVDGPSTQVDAKIGTTPDKNPWRSMLATTTGAGAKGLFVLDVTNRSNFSLASDNQRENLFMWEISNEYPLDENTSSPVYADMGYILNQVSIIRVHFGEDEERWFLVTGNGVASETGKTVLYIINLVDGSLFQQLVVATEGDSGMTSATAVDIDDDSYIDRIYGGDLQGNVWRFDWNHEVSKFDSFYTSGNSPQPLFSASSASASPIDAGDGLSRQQSIVSGFEVGQLPGKGNSDGTMIYFGTGKFHDISDHIGHESTAESAVNTRQSFYGIWDSNIAFGFNRDRLVQQQFTSFDNTKTSIRTVTNLVPVYAIERDLGWVIDIPVVGERIIEDPALIHGRIQFTSLLPTGLQIDDPCITGTSGWITELNPITGGNPDSLVFDVNEDDELNQDDKAPDNQPVAGIESESSARTRPAVIKLDSDVDSKLIRISSGRDGRLVQTRIPVTVKRLSWRRLE